MKGGLLWEYSKERKRKEERDTWYVDYRDPTGKRIIKAVGPSKREAQDYLGKVKASIREGRFFDIKKEKRATFNDLLNSYVEKVKDEKYFKTSIKYFIPVLREHFGDMLVSEIDYKVLEDFRDERRKRLLNMVLRGVTGQLILKWRFSVISSVKV